MKPLTLFDEESTLLQPAPGRTEPLIWIRNLRILDALRSDAEVIRSIPFKRGLNVIATAEHPGNDEISTVGHSVGKSLLSRLIRFCFGEPGYAERSVRQGIIGFLPHGYVVAEIIVDGTTWHVARPIGLDSANSASWSASAESHLFESDDRLPFAIFQEAVNAAVIAPFPAIRLPQAGRPIAWTDLLGWLSPDQDCAHQSHAQWRPGGIDPTNRGLAIEDNNVIIRTVMDLLSSEDSGLITSHKELLSQQGQLGRQIDLARAVMEARLRDVQTAASDGELQGTIETAILEKNAREQREALLRLLEDELEDDPVQIWREKNSALQQKIGAAREKLTAEQNDLDTATAQLAVLMDESGELEANAALGRWCELFPTESEAVSKGCPGNSCEADATGPDPRRVNDTNATIKEATARRNRLQAVLDGLEKDATASKEEFNNARREVHKRRQPLRDKIAHYENVERLAVAYRRAEQHFDHLENQRRSIKTHIRESLKTRKDADRNYRENHETLNQRFAIELSGLLGQEVDGTIRIDANGISPQAGAAARSRGIALRTSSVFAFDLSCLAASIAGLGYHPRFRLHDSPGTADMERPLYQRLFNVIAAMEEIFEDNEPSFQYIITTTTAPPKKFLKKPYLSLLLDGRKPDGFLLGRQF